MNEALTSKHAAAIKNPTERIFATSAIAAGLKIFRGPSIKCDRPVVDRLGRNRKTTTTPDFEAVDPEKPEKRMLVEVTNGSGNLPSKEAQRRVISQAGITNYIIITGYDAQDLADAPTPKAKRSLINRLFGWNKTEQ